MYKSNQIIITVKNIKDILKTERYMSYIQGLISTQHMSIQRKLPQYFYHPIRAKFLNT